MKRNNFFSRFIVVTLTAALLLMSGSRAIPVSALADPIVQEVAPVYDTVIYQFQDYIENDLTEPQLELFSLLWAAYQFAMAGSQDYQLENPYATQDGVLNWLKSLGVDSYNTLISFAPDVLQMPDGSFLYTDSIKRSLKASIEAAMGLALESSKYDDVDDFMNNIQNVDYYFIPWNQGIMYGLNLMYEQFGGIYAWQFDRKAFMSDDSWRFIPLSGIVAEEYGSRISQFSTPYVRLNVTREVETNAMLSSPILFNTYTNVFINTVNHTVQLVDDNGLSTNLSYDSLGVSVDTNAYGSSVNSSWSPSIYTNQFTYNPNSYVTYEEIAQAAFDHDYYLIRQIYVFLEDFVKHVYAGSSWSDKVELFNDTDHNLTNSTQPYYIAPPTEDNYLLDLKGILLDLLNNSNLLNIYIDNLYTPDGLLVHDTDLIRIAIKILVEYENDNPPIPINMNDIAELTDNSYLERVKEHARNAGDIFANYVAFWHNCDSDLVYTMFGAVILVLVGAFIGKWGHS